VRTPCAGGFHLGVRPPGAGRGTVPRQRHRDRATKLRAYFKLPTVQRYLIVWSDDQRIVCHSRRPDGEIATRIFVSGEIGLDPPGIVVTVEAFYVD